MWNNLQTYYARDGTSSMIRKQSPPLPVAIYITLYVHFISGNIYICISSIQEQHDSVGVQLLWIKELAYQCNPIYSGGFSTRMDTALQGRHRIKSARHFLRAIWYATHHGIAVFESETVLVVRTRQMEQIVHCQKFVSRSTWHHEE